MATSKQVRKLYNDEVELTFNPDSRKRYTVVDQGQTSYPVGVTSVLGKVLAKEGLALWPMYMALEFISENADRLTLVELVEQAAKAHTIKSDSGKDIGGRVHEWIEGFLNSLPEGVSDIKFITPNKEIEKPVQAFLGWFEKVKPKVLATEQIVYSREGRYAGTFDALLEIDGKIILADVKTSNRSRTAPHGVYVENFLQLGAYSKAYIEEATWTLKHGVPGTRVQITRTMFSDERRVDDLLVINAGKDGQLSTLRASELDLTVQMCESQFLHCLWLYKFLTPLQKIIKEKK